MRLRGGRLSDVARMSAATCGSPDRQVPDVASLIRATFAGTYGASALLSAIATNETQDPRRAFQPIGRRVPFVEEHDFHVGADAGAGFVLVDVRRSGLSDFPKILSRIRALCSSAQVKCSTFGKMESALSKKCNADV
jgi:hypothetical protein